MEWPSQRWWPWRQVREQGGAGCSKYTARCPRHRCPLAGELVFTAATKAEAGSCPPGCPPAAAGTRQQGRGPDESKHLLLRQPGQGSPLAVCTQPALSPPSSQPSSIPAHQRRAGPHTTAQHVPSKPHPPAASPRLPLIHTHSHQVFYHPPLLPAPYRRGAGLPQQPVMAAQASPATGGGPGRHP